MQTPPGVPGAPITWTVGPQSVTTIPDGRGGFEPGYSITFTLSNGHTDTVTVPTSAYSVETVQAAIAAKAATIAAVYNLTGTV